MKHKSYIILLLSVLFLILLERATHLSIQIISKYQETPLCHSCTETMLAKGGEQNGEPIVLGKNVALFCPGVAITYRLAAAHTRLQEPLFRRRSSASWWSHHGGIWPSWSHSLLWCSPPHPAGHFCNTGNVVSADPSSLQAYIFHVSFVKMHPSPQGPCGRSPCLLGCGYPLSPPPAPGVGVQLKVDERFSDPSPADRDTLKALYSICCGL